MASLLGTVTIARKAHQFQQETQMFFLKSCFADGSESHG